MNRRQTMNVSLPLSQERFVRAQVKSGRYRTASEVVRSGLRLLEKAEHRRLLEKWLYEGLTDGEREQLPAELIEQARANFQQLIDDAERSAEERAWLDRQEVLSRLAAKQKARLTEDR